ARRVRERRGDQGDEGRKRLFRSEHRPGAAELHREQRPVHGHRELQRGRIRVHGEGGADARPHVQQGAEGGCPHAARHRRGGRSTRPERARGDRPRAAGRAVADGRNHRRDLARGRVAEPRESNRNAQARIRGRHRRGIGRPGEGHHEAPRGRVRDEGRQALQAAVRTGGVRSLGSLVVPPSSLVLRPWFSVGPWFLVLGSSSLVLGCTSTQPSKTTVTPAPTIQCPSAPAPVQTATMQPVTVSYGNPTVTNGTQPVSVTCTPTSGAGFPVGSTTVTCTATDAVNRSASCSFAVVVTFVPPPPRLSVTRFVAFGDSITQGAVPDGSYPTRFRVFQLLPPDVAYPGRLATLLKARYTAQTQQIVVFNEGLQGETAVAGAARLPRALA